MTASTLRPSPIALPRARTAADEALGLSILYIGPPKSGKTTCALSFPDPFVFYFEPNLAGLRASNPTPPYLLVDDMKPEPIAALQQQILPAIAAGRIGELTDRPVKTLVFDSLTVLLGEHLSKKIRGAKDALKGFDDFGMFLYAAENLISGQLTPLCRRGFNVVATVHLAEYGGGDEPSTRRPSIPGNFRNILCSRFDAVLLTGSELAARKVRGPNGTESVVREPDYFVQTINPDRSYEGIGDGLGRTGGHFRTLPPKLDGRYPSLATAWGLDTKPAI